MGHKFEAHNEVDIDATVEQVWQAIATGPGIDSWFMGRNDVDSGAAGTVRTVFGGYAPQFPITSWEPQRQFAYRSEDEDGRFIAYEFLIEGRAGGSTSLRMAVSGFLPDDDWAEEYEAMTKGGEMFFRTLVHYLRHFPGRFATPVTAFGPMVNDWPHAWRVLRDELGLLDAVREGDPARLTAPGLGSVDGTVYYVNSQTLGIYTPDSTYRFLQGFHGPMVAAHLLFTAVDRDEAEQDWQAWLARLFA